MLTHPNRTCRQKRHFDSRVRQRPVRFWHTFDRDAVLNVVKTRLCPILMTSIAFILGVLPLAFADGVGVVSRQTIGWTILGGNACRYVAGYFYGSGIVCGNYTINKQEERSQITSKVVFLLKIMRQK